MTRKAKAVRVTRTLTPEQEANVVAVRKDELEHQDEYAAEARRFFAAKDRAAAMLRNAFLALRKERKRQGLSFAEMGEMSGMSRSAVSNLEQGTRGNPSLTTLLRCAEALGLEVRIQLEQSEPASAAKRQPKKP